MSNFYLGITDSNWLSILKNDYDKGILPNKVNFWTPGCREFKAIESGELFMFKMHNKKSTGEKGEIVGGGYFSHYDTMSISDAWDKYGRGNGRETLEDMKISLNRIQKNMRTQPSNKIGCIILEDIFFLDKWIEEPTDWSKSIVSGKKYSTDTEIGLELYNRINHESKKKEFIGPTNVSIGKFYSWIIESNNIAMKLTDKSVFESHGSGVPKEIRGFFEAEELTLEDRLELTLVYDGKEYRAYIKKESVLERTRIFWYSDLSKKFNDYYNQVDRFPILLFERIGYAKYAIRFIEDTSKKIIEPLDDTHPIEEKENHAVDMDIESLKIAAENHSKNEIIEKEITTKQVIRDPYVAEYTKRRSNGICQLCGNKAPFEDANGRPYLESHHVIWLSRGGKDSIGNTVALCPNCHRKMHVVDNTKDIEFLLYTLEKTNK